MITDSESFLTGQTHITGDYIHALFTVAVGHLVIILKGIDSLPRALLVLDVTEAFFVYVDLAKVVKEGYDGDALVAVLRADNVDGARRFQIAIKAVVHVYRVVDKSALI